MTIYGKLIASKLQGIGSAHDPRHVEAVMRDHLGTLDNLSPREFGVEVARAALEVESMNAELAEALAWGYGVCAPINPCP